MLYNRELKQQAKEKLAKSQQEKKIILFYAGCMFAVSVIYMLSNLLITYLTPQTGGLSTIGRRSFMSALSGLLPVISFLLSMCLGFGYLGGMVRVSREQYASPNALRTGFERFWPLMRLNLFKGLILFGYSMCAAYLTSMIFILSPFSAGLEEAMIPMVSNGSLLNQGSVVLDEGVMNAIYDSAIPVLVIFLLVELIFVVPMLYRLRMCDYVLYDHPEAGALYSIRESRKMMRCNRFSMFKLDISFWWFYLALTVCSALNYVPVLLALVGVTLPMSANVSSVLFFLLSCGAEFALFYFLRNKIEVTYALAYNQLKPKEVTGGAVLGNIFQM